MYIQQPGMKKISLGIYICLGMLFIGCKGQSSPASKDSGSITADTTFKKIDTNRKIKITSPAGAATTPGGIGIGNGSKAHAVH